MGQLGCHSRHPPASSWRPHSSKWAHLPVAATMSRHRHFCQGHRPAPEGILPINHHKFLAKGLFQFHGLGAFSWPLASFPKPLCPWSFPKPLLLIHFWSFSKPPPTPGSFPKPLLQGSGLASPWTPSCPRASCMQDPFPKSSASWKRGCSIVNLLCFNLCFRLGLGKLLTVFLVDVLDVAFSKLQVLVVVDGKIAHTVPDVFHTIGRWATNFLLKVRWHCKLK